MNKISHKITEIVQKLKAQGQDQLAASFLSLANDLEQENKRHLTASSNIKMDVVEQKPKSVNVEALKKAMNKKLTHYLKYKDK